MLAATPTWRASCSEWGFAVRAYDQRGHSESGGKPGVIGSDDILLENLAEVVDATRQRCLRLPHADPQKPMPIVLLGHSLGGLVAARFVALKTLPVQGLVLSSPALDAGFSLRQKLLLSMLGFLAPDLAVNSGLNSEYLSHDPEVVRAYETDLMVHQRISARLAKLIASAGRAALQAAPPWDIPTLLMYAGADRIARPEGSRAFAQACLESSNARPRTLTVRCFEGFHHELFNDVGAHTVFDSFRSWLDTRF